jgi:hypothetical protein
MPIGFSNNLLINFGILIENPDSWQFKVVITTSKWPKFHIFPIKVSIMYIFVGKNEDKRMVQKRRRIGNLQLFLYCLIKIYYCNNTFFTSLFWQIIHFKQKIQTALFYTMWTSLKFWVLLASTHLTDIGFPKLVLKHMEHVNLLIFEGCLVVYYR